MKIFNRDIESCGPEWLNLSRFYASRARSIWKLGDFIQLLSQWPVILSRYALFGLDCTREVIWDWQLERILEYPNHQPSVLFGDKENRICPDNAK